MPLMFRVLLFAVLCLVGLTVPHLGRAEPIGVFLHGGGGRPLVALAEPAKSGPATASLFTGQSGGSFFAPLPPRPRPEPARAVGPIAAPTVGGTPIQRLRHLIAQAEAGAKGYDAVVWAAKIKPPKRPTAMTVQEIYTWIKATPGQHHAIGRYQFIPATLRRLVKKLGVDPSERFSPQLQDRLADQLLAEAGLSGMMAGRISRRDFMNNIAKIWAGLPNSTGKSHYAGYAGNKATMSWARFEREMKAIFPEA
ncbi:hypothetical protein [Pacificoceanicola onchidii]|uniref:hypothetical protein n=1 Tax=Pacificoceanicola onchidii TaxID=2562685 RepID=UPI0010A5968B|nr:hypothetical protein [Pacificoceanicola onchidii]